MKILAVDDEPIQLQCIRSGLRTEGHQVIPARSVEEALKQLNDSPDQIDLILTDYIMAGASGLDLLKAVREKNRSIPFILMTAYGERELVVEALKNNCDGFIDKPFSPEQLLAEIERVKNKQSQDSNSRLLYDIFPRIAHQFNNPLMVIRGFSELGLLDLDNPSTMKRNLEAILEATQQLHMINNKILSLGRIAVDDKVKTEVTEIIDRCLKCFAGLIELNGIHLEKEVAESLLNVLANPFSLEQIFKNLIMNAIEAMEGRPEKRLGIIAGMKPSTAMVWVQIKDTGCGIPPAVLNSNFSAWKTTKKNGTGLGLRVVRDLLERHGGRLEIQSRVGEGTVMAVLLPALN